jgi:hypothetical protein
MGIDVLGITHFGSRLAAVESGKLQAELVKGLHAAGTPIRNDMGRATFTRIQRHALGSVEFRKESDGLMIVGGRGGGLDATLFMGGEFGGRLGKKRRVRGYVFGRPVRATPGVVTRRTTMQFLPHLGERGYFFWPTLRIWEPKLVELADKLVVEFMGR